MSYEFALRDVSEQPINVFCRTGVDDWSRVLSHNAGGLDCERDGMTFKEAWDVSARATDDPSDGRAKRKGWEELLVPLPALKGPSWAYGLTYCAHQKESRQEKMVCFEKRGEPTGAWVPIPHRPALDYEAEIALLLHRQEPERFGYLLANDLTDRAKQVETFDRRNPAPGFAEAKSFPGALHVGPLLAIGGAEVWPKLESELRVNGELRQSVNARECLLGPREFHDQIFTRGDASDWALVLTGTTGGTIFQGPTPAKKLWLFLANGFSVRRAGQAWLRRFEFLRVGDRLEMSSKILGTSHATIVAEAK
jgi:2-keto-4-pentenoate hydratase/2-oxohepta-3-ene-1,7-dioic acid hydratase in catechol pathway